MSIFTMLGNPISLDVTNRKPKTAKELLLAGIERQRGIVLGEQVTGTRGSKARSWFNKDKLHFKPFIGIYSLMSGKGWIYATGTEMEVLNNLEASVENSELDSAIAAIQKCMDKRESKQH